MAVAANSIITPQIVKSATAVAVTANSTYTDAPTNSLTLVTAGANGSRLVKVVAIARATVTATELQLYRDGDGTGTTKRLFNSKLLPAYTVAGTTANTPTDFGYSDANPLRLGVNEKIYVAIGVSLANGVAFTAEWQDY